MLHFNMFEDIESRKYKGKDHGSLGASSGACEVLAQGSNLGASTFIWKQHAHKSERQVLMDYM